MGEKTLLWDDVLENYEGPLYFGEWFKNSWKYIIDNRLILADNCKLQPTDKTLWISTLYEIYMDYLYILKKDGLISEKSNKLYRYYDIEVKYDEEIAIRRNKFVSQLLNNFDGNSIKLMYFMAGYCDSTGRSKETNYGLDSSVSIPKLYELVNISDYSQTRKIIPLYLWIRNGMERLTQTELAKNSIYYAELNGRT